MAHSEGCCIRAVPALSDEVSRRIHTNPRVANRLPAFSSVAAVDQKWFSGAALDVSNDQNRVGHPRAVRINREITPATPETAPENYFRFAAAILKMAEINWACLGQSKSIDKSRRRHREPFQNSTSGLLPPRWKQSKSTGPATDRRNPSTIYIGEPPLHDRSN